MNSVLIILHIMACLVLILVVLLQRGKGTDVGATLGGGGGNTVFGSRGAGNFLTKLTTGSAIIFMTTSLTLAYYGNQSSNPLDMGGDILSPTVAEETEPGTDAPSAGALEEIEFEPSANTLEEIPQPESD